LICRAELLVDNASLPRSLDQHAPTDHGGWSRAATGGAAEKIKRRRSVYLGVDRTCADHRAVSPFDPSRT